ncbi:hypothetical protein BH10ACI4_BH10ACI4_28800 [soil metagenome]
MRQLSTTIGISFLTMTLSIPSFARIGQQNGVPPGTARNGFNSQARSKTSAGKRDRTIPSRVAPVQEEAAPSPQARTRASLQDAAAHEPVPDERTLRLQREESKRIVEERKRSERRDGVPQTQIVPTRFTQAS